MRVFLTNWYVPLLEHIEISIVSIAEERLRQGLEKKIPGAPENETPVHLRKRQIFSHNISSIRDIANSEDRAK